VHACLGALDRDRQDAVQRQDAKQALMAAQLPADVADVIPGFLYQPDNNSLAWKAFNEAASELKMSTEALLLHLHVWPHALALHQAKFLREHFPKGTDFDAYSIPSIKESFPEANVIAYSLDDTETTEVDDALSVTLEDDMAIVGVHI